MGLRDGTAGVGLTYTSNWPPDPVIGNKPSAGVVLWTGFSVIMLLVGVGLLHTTTQETGLM